MSVTRRPVLTMKSINNMKKKRHPSLSVESSLHFSATRHRNRNRDRNRNRNEMTPDNDPDFDSHPVATRYAAMGPGQEPEPGKSVNRKMKDAGYRSV